MVMIINTMKNEIKEYWQHEWKIKMNADKKSIWCKSTSSSIPMVMHNVLIDLVPTSVSLFTRLPFMSKLCI